MRVNCKKARVTYETCKNVCSNRSSKCFSSTQTIRPSASSCNKVQHLLMISKLRLYISNGFKVWTFHIWRKSRRYSAALPPNNSCWKGNWQMSHIAEGSAHSESVFAALDIISSVQGRVTRDSRTLVTRGIDDLVPGWLLTSSYKFSNKHL